MSFSLPSLPLRFPSLPPAPHGESPLVKVRAHVPVQPLSKDPALDAIPGNTAKVHGRDFSTWLFFSFKEDALASERGLLLAHFIRACASARWHTSLNTQLTGWRAFQNAKRVGEPDKNSSVADQPFGTVLLTRGSLRVLGTLNADGRYAEFLGLNRDFYDGMFGQRQGLHDPLDPAVPKPPPEVWADYDACDVALLLAGGTRANCAALVSAATVVAKGFSLELIGCEHGFAWRPGGSGSPTLEPFGFRDGISNLLFLDDDLAEQRTAGVTAWNHQGRWEQLLYWPRGGAGEPKSGLVGGSFVVLRKLEQNVDAFRTWEAAQATTPPGPVEPGAAMIGRQRDGCPLGGRPATGQLNDFNYDNDAAGTRCPFHTHVRKSNPRSRDALERDALFVRRAQVYAPQDQLALDTRAVAGVGLLFTGYMGSLSQFRTVNEWLHDAGFPVSGAGEDPLIVGVPGQPAFVTPRGGGYFFAPPITWIDSLPA